MTWQDYVIVRADSWMPLRKLPEAPTRCDGISACSVSAA